MFILHCDCPFTMFHQHLYGYLVGQNSLTSFCAPNALFKAKTIANPVISFLNRAAWTMQTLSCTPAGSSPSFALYDLHSTEGLLEMESLHVYLLAGWSERSLFIT